MRPSPAGVFTELDDVEVVCCRGVQLITKKKHRQKREKNCVIRLHFRTEKENKVILLIFFKSAVSNHTICVAIIPNFLQLKQTEDRRSLLLCSTNHWLNGVLQISKHGYWFLFNYWDMSKNVKSAHFLHQYINVIIVIIHTKQSTCWGILKSAKIPHWISKFINWIKLS